MAQFQILAHGIAAQVQIAVFHPQVVTAIGIVLDGERRRDALAQDIQLAGDDLNIARGNIGILAGTLGNGAHNLDDVFTSQVVGLLTQLSVHLVVKHDLGDTITVTQVHKGHATHLAGALHPSCQSHDFAHIGQTKFAVSLCSIHCLDVVLILLVCRYCRFKHTKLLHSRHKSDLQSQKN